MPSAAPRILSSLVCAALLLATAGIGVAHAVPTLSVEPDTSFVYESLNFWLTLEINEEVLGLTGFHVILDYDETLMEVVGAEAGDLIIGSGYETFFYWEDLGGTSRHMLLDGAVLGGYVNGPGALADIEFHAAYAGTSIVHIVEEDLRDINNDPIPVEIEDGVVIIKQMVPVERHSWAVIKALFRQ